ncbi:zinc-finger [Amycolatopsis tolypomycina]|uniref:Zinc-finger n=1 Tax=Amycolatopsis tolypomycina TaxID=208445 RepID=A0A1H4JC58_9PSEU|nr:zinc finger protein [Amycolatopsis tolypomycina]SEB43791.1 zinc-finger [Amycolatopsis tolypomycina]
MTALLYLDLEHMFPVVQGVRHRSIFARVPDPGTEVRMLCGLVAVAEYADAAKRNTHGVQTLCWGCDAEYRRQQGIPSRTSRQR